MIAAAWDDVWRERSAVIKAGWPVFIVVLGAILAQMIWSLPMPLRLSPIPLLGGTSSSHNYAIQSLTAPILLCANSFAIGAWARLIASGEIGWGLGRRGFLPVLLVRLKALAAYLVVLALGLAAYRALELGGRREFAARLASFLIPPICLIGLDVLTVRLSLVVPYAALTEKSDLRGGMALARGHGWPLFLLILCAATTVLAVIVAGTLGLTLVVAVLGSVLVHSNLPPALSRCLIGLVSAAGVFMVYFPCLLFAVGVLTRAYLEVVRQAEPDPWRA